MIRITKLEFAPSTKSAAARCVKKYHGYCVQTGLSPEDRPTSPEYALEVAHVFPRSTFPELRMCVQNLLPYIALRHSWRYGHDDSIGCLDLKDSTDLGSFRTPMQRIQWIAETTHEKMRPQVFKQLRYMFVQGAADGIGCLLSRRDEALEIIGAHE